MDLIDKIKNNLGEGTQDKFLGQTVKKVISPVAVRSELQSMAEAGEISPAEYYKLLKITWDGIKDTVFAKIEYREIAA